MQLRRKISMDIPIERNEEKEKGFVENLIPKFLIKLLAKEDETRLIPVSSKIKQLRKNLGMNEVIYLKINDRFTPKNLYAIDNIDQVVVILEKNKGTTKSIYFTTRKSAENIEITSKVLIEAIPSNNFASVSITNYGMVQIPKDLRAETFLNDAQKAIRAGFLEKCEKTFADFTDRMAKEFNGIFNMKPVVSKIEKTLVVPSGKDKKTSKFYNRKFASQKNTLPPSFYKESSTNPSYRYNGYSDPFDVMWWIIIFDHSTPTAAAANNFIDSNGKEITCSEAVALVNSADKASLSGQLEAGKDQFANNRYETFLQSVEATKFAETSNDTHTSSDPGTNAVIAGAGNENDGHNTHVDTDCTTDGGGCTGGCTAGCTG